MKLTHSKTWLIVAGLFLASTLSVYAEKTVVKIVEMSGRTSESQRGGPSNWLNAIDKFEKANPDIDIEVVTIPSSGDGSDGYTKEDIMTASGDNYDLIEHTNPIRWSKYVASGFAYPLNELAKAASYDLDKKFGKYLKKYEGGKVYWLPSDVSPNIVFYNKSLFDKAGIPYPKAGWTWDDYKTIAMKLTDAKKGVYGSLMQTWEYYTYIGPMQKNISAYKADGSSNFDAPEFATYLQWFKDMGKTWKAQPHWQEMTDKNFQWDSFMSGKFGMEMIGFWHMGIAGDKKTYPRDWKIGIAPPPVAADGKGNNILTSGGGFMMNKNAAHPKEAFRVLSFFMDEYPTIAPDQLLARADLPKSQISARFEKTALNFVDDGITADIIGDVVNDNGLGIAPEKIVGPASAQINDMYVKEAEKFFVGAQDLKKTIENMKKKADDLIKKEMASKK